MTIKAPTNRDHASEVTVTALLDLDAPNPEKLPAGNFSRVRTIVGLVAAAAVLGGFAGAGVVLGLNRVTADPPAPSIIVAAEESPTVTAWYADGTHGEASAALAGPWTPDRPLRMLTVAAGANCSITINEHLAVVEAAPANRLAVCVWVSPN